MLKLLILVVGAILIYALLKGYFRNLQRGDTSHSQPPTAENMVRCAHCNVNIPTSEAIFSRGEYYCCDEHRRARQQ